MIEDEDMVEENRDLLVTESTIKKDISLDCLDSELRERKITGRVEVHYNQGGRRRVVLVETTTANEAQRVKMRRALGMD